MLIGQRLNLLFPHNSAAELLLLQLTLQILYENNISNHLILSCLLDLRDTCLIARWCNDMQMCFVASVDIAGIADVSCESEGPLWQVTRGTGPDKAMVSGHRCRPPGGPRVKHIGSGQCPPGPIPSVTSLSSLSAVSSLSMRSMARCSALSCNSIVAE